MCERKGFTQKAFRPDKYERRIDMYNESKVLVLRDETHCAISSRSHKQRKPPDAGGFFCFSASL